MILRHLKQVLQRKPLTVRSDRSTTRDPGSQTALISWERSGFGSVKRKAGGERRKRVEEL